MFLILKIIVLLAAVFMMRPTALGQMYTDVGIGLSIFSLFLHFIELSVRKTLVLTKKNAIVLFTSLALWGYLFVQAGIAGSNHMDFVIKASIAHILIVVSAALILSDLKANKTFFRAFIYILAICSVSYLVTIILSFFTNFDSLWLFQLPVKGYEEMGVGNIYFPFTIMYSFMGVGNVLLPRLLGPFREAGIYQAFLIWAFFSLKHFNLDKKWIKFALITGIIGTFSTAGIGIFLGTLAVKLFINKRKINAVLLMIFMVLAVNYTPYIGLASKSITHSTSITDRTDSTLTGLKNLWDNPLGIGLYHSNYGDIENAGINLLASTNMIGLIGLALVILVYFLPMYNFENKRSYFVSILPLFITGLISQPILDAPLIYLMLLANYSQDNGEMIASEPTRSMFKRLKIKKIVW